MSVPVQNPINQVVIVGAEVVLPWKWNLQKEEEITVLVQRALDGSVDTLTLNSDYTVEANDLDNDNGGDITPIGSESPVTTGDVWTLFRVTAVDRSPDFATSGAFFALTINEQLDELTRIAQDINRDVANAVRKDPGVGDILNPLIPQPVDERALKFRDTGGGNFEMVMSEFDPDAAGDAEASAAEAAASASEASDSADEAAASAASAAGLYGQVLEVSVNTIITESQSGFLITVDTSSGDIDITLPDSSSLGGDFRVAVAKLTSDANQVNVKVAGSDTVNQGTADIVQNIQNRIVDYVLDQSEAEYTASNVEEILSEALNTNGFPINTSRSTVAGTATTSDIWGAAIGNEIDFTGAPTVTNFPNAPRAGVSRILHIASTPIFTDNANLFVQGNANYTASAGDVVRVHAISVSTFRLTILKDDGKAVISTGAAFETQLLHVVDEKGASTDAGTFTAGADRTRDLNTIRTNEITGASLSSNAITLPIGIFYVEASAPGFQVNQHQAKIVNTSGTAVSVIGTKESAGGSASTTTISLVSGRFTTAATTVVELKHRCQSTVATNGFGLGSLGLGNVNIYAVVKIWKVG